MVEVVSAATSADSRRPVLVLPQQPLDLGADLRLGGFAVGPIDRKVRTDALDEFGGDRRDLRIRGAIFDGAAR